MNKKIYKYNLKGYDFEFFGNTGNYKLIHNNIDFNGTNLKTILHCIEFAKYIIKYKTCYQLTK
tara:strand:+ start:361 stop:549 length:189 start_codon:yes stop_codon:yes gene_type:complete